MAHPTNPAINYLDQVLFCQNVPEEDGGYLAQCIFGDAQADISPCGTGTSTRLAQRYFRGLIGLEETFVQKSVCGGAFHAKGLRETTLGGVPGDRPLRVLLGRPHHRVQPPYRGRKRQAEERVRFLVAVAEG